MCGIVGYLGTQTATDILISGLERLEYRGYDSAGIATIWEDQLHSLRAKGKLYQLKEKLEGNATPATIGIGHTRWATHGRPEEHNAHPHVDPSKRVAVVQNGIVENYRDLKDTLIAKGHVFLSETDTEVIPYLIADYLKESTASADSFFDAVRQAVNRLEGAFAIAVVCADYPDELIVARQHAPLTLGFGQGEFFCASDITALIPHTSAVLTLENGEMARMNPLGVEVYNFRGERLKKNPRTLDWNPGQVEKQGFRHYMLKEIHEQPSVVRTSLEAYLNPETEHPIQLGIDEPGFLNDIDHIQIFACGTSWHASLIGRYLLESLAKIPTQVHYASEFRYFPSPLIPNTLTIGVTQSGETADTLAALSMAREQRLHQGDNFKPRLLAITNRTESSITHVVDHVLYTHAGLEIGVAATKTFVTQLMNFYFLALELAIRRKTITPERVAALISGLREIPEHIESILKTQEKRVEELAHSFSDTQDFVFIGRGVNFPVALEGALKLKEISYIHAEGYPAGELKHGPIALLDDKVPVVAIAMPGETYEKVISNAQEAKARDARLLGVTIEGDSEAAQTFDEVMAVPPVDELLSPLLSVVPLQILSYYIAARRGLDVDQPRNLAKSVTVE